MIKLEKILLPAAEMGEYDPLPDIKNNTYIHASIKRTENVGENDLPNIGKGMIPTMLPYLTQNGYSRDKKMRELDIIVLENEFLRAEFMPSYGARLRRLYDKVRGRELLYVNPVFQPCNLALRSAWFSGGVEFNACIKGHTPFTCEKVFAEKRRDPEGKEYLSFYEYERIRGIVWSVSAYLPEGARALKLKCTLENPSKEEKYTYWWSNIAVDESEGMRVIVPAKSTYVNYFGNDSYVLDKADMPNIFGKDASYPSNSGRSIDYFYDIDESRRKWIASADKDGRGLLHYSENRLFGRKLFLWGNMPGGRHWAEYLSKENSSYIEIQAGLAKTQLEHFIINGESTIEWCESYAPLDLDPTLAHGEWKYAVEAVEKELDGYEKEETLFPSLENCICEKLCSGSLWGALEEKISEKAVSRYFKNWDSDMPDGKYFENLIKNGILDAPDDPNTPPLGYVTGERWEKLLEGSLKREKGENYAAYLHLGVNLYGKYCYENNPEEKAKIAEKMLEMWEKSVMLCKNPWALRNIGAFYANELKNYKKALPYIISAVEMYPDSRTLAIDCAGILLAAERAKAAENADKKLLPEENCLSLWLSVREKLSENVKANGRVTLLTLSAYIGLDMLEKASAIFESDFELADIKEGEVSISELYFIYKAKENGISLNKAKEIFDLPYRFDFRMH